MTIEYSNVLKSYIVKNQRKTIIIYAPAFRNHCKKYGIPMKKYRDLIQYLKSPKCYLPKEILGFN